MIFGGPGENVLFGGIGTDRLSGGFDNDELFGGKDGVKFLDVLVTIYSSGVLVMMTLKETKVMIYF